MKYIRDNICNVKNGYIFHPCNCVSLHPRGLSKNLADNFPDTCPYYFRSGKDYANLQTRSTPGTVCILGNENGPDIVNMFIQQGPGKPNAWKDTEYYLEVPDDFLSRENYFQQCLDAMFDYFEFTDQEVKIAVPYRIGRGKWHRYKEMLEQFEKKMIDSGIKTEITVYKI